MDTNDTKAKPLWLVTKAILGVLCVLCVDAAVATAQPGGFAMPDPKQMSGIPRPVDDLPNGAISVRLIRGSLSNNIIGHPVDLLPDDVGVPRVARQLLHLVHDQEAPTDRAFVVDPVPRRGWSERPPVRIGRSELKRDRISPMCRFSKKDIGSRMRRRNKRAPS